VLWHTEGKGDEDLHVHHFEKITDVPLKEIGVENEQSIQCVLPASPLSYHGQLIRLSWCVRMRLFLEDGREVLSESPFMSSLTCKLLLVLLRLLKVKPNQKI